MSEQPLDGGEALAGIEDVLGKRTAQDVGRHVVETRSPHVLGHEDLHALGLEWLAALPDAELVVSNRRSIRQVALKRPAHIVVE